MSKVMKVHYKLMKIKKIYIYFISEEFAITYIVYYILCIYYTLNLHSKTYCHYGY